jgi:hypothetical protein
MRCVVSLAREQVVASSVFEHEGFISDQAFDCLQSAEDELFIYCY